MIITANLLVKALMRAKIKTKELFKNLRKLILTTDFSKNLNSIMKKQKKDIKVETV